MNEDIYMYMKTKHEIFLQWNTKFSLQKVPFLLHFASSRNCMAFANLVAETYKRLCNKKTLSTWEPCTCEYLTLLRGTLAIWYQTLKNVVCNFFHQSENIIHLDRFKEISSEETSKVKVTQSNGYNSWLRI